MDAIRYASRDQLKQIAAEGDALGFNRQIAPLVLKKLATNVRFGVKQLLIHEHIRGVPADPHVRTHVGFQLKDGTIGSVFIDMTLATFSGLSMILAEASSFEEQTIIPSLELTFV